MLYSGNLMTVPTAQQVRQQILDIASDLERIEQWVGQYLEIGQSWRPSIPVNPIDTGNSRARRARVSTRDELAKFRRQCLAVALTVRRPSHNISETVNSVAELITIMRHWASQWRLLVRGIEQDWADLAHGDRGDPPREDYMDMQPVFEFADWMSEPNLKILQITPVLVNYQQHLIEIWRLNQRQK